MRKVYVGHSLEGYTLHIQDSPWWAHAVEAVAATRVVEWPLHRFGLEWGFDLWQWLMSMTWRHQTAEWVLPLDEVTALEMSPPGTWDYVHTEDK